MRPNPRQWNLRGARIAMIAAVAVAGAGCSQDNPVPICRNCEAWDQLTTGLARFPDPHPTLEDIYVYSTIQKRVDASDSQRESDEDIWLLLVNDPEDPRANVSYQVTGDEVGTSGDNFAPRWSPDGTQIVFTHSRAEGGLEVWRVAVNADSTDATGAAPVIGTPEVLAPSGRDPEWIANDEILFSDGDKLFRQTVPPPPGPRGGGAATQLTYGPPIFASSEEYLDRHPDESDGVAIFNTTGRQPVADIFVDAIEPDSGGVDPNAFLLLRPPGTVGSYPLFEGADTLRTPFLLRSLPLNLGNRYVVGAKIDLLFLPPPPDSLTPPRETYCDTLITAILDLEPGKTDSVRFTFEHARGTLRVTSTVGVTSFTWSRADSLVKSSRVTTLENAGSAASIDCLLAYEVGRDSLGTLVPMPPTPEPYLITATAPSRPGEVYRTTAFLTPAGTTNVVLFAPEPGVDEIPSELPTGPVVRTSARSAPPSLTGGQPAFGLRAEGDLSTIWQIEFPTPTTVDFHEITGAPGRIQHPALTREFPGRVRFLAWVSDESGDWQLYLQRFLVNDQGGLERDGAAFSVETPGTLDNLDCDRDVFQPRFLPTSTAQSLKLVVGMGDCPNHGFEDLGFDDDPWAVGEYRVWTVTVDVVGS